MFFKKRFSKQTLVYHWWLLHFSEDSVSAAYSCKNLLHDACLLAAVCCRFVAVQLLHDVCDFTGVLWVHLPYKDSKASPTHTPFHGPPPQPINSFPHTPFPSTVPLIFIQAEEGGLLIVSHAHISKVCPSACAERLGGGGWSREAPRVDRAIRTAERKMHNTINTFMARMFSFTKAIPCSMRLYLYSCSHSSFYSHDVCLWCWYMVTASMQIEGKGGNSFLWMFMVLS